jgi:glycerol-3-phosphate acyltransferase PlsY
MIEALKLLLIGAISYILGSLSFALAITRRLAGIDVRTVGSGHATATNTMRAAGWGPAAVVAVLDVAKGSAAVWLAERISTSEWAPIIAAGMVVIGHCWSLFAQFRGGMGMASGFGALLVTWPLGAVIVIGLGALLQLVVRHSARANVLTGLLLAPLWAVFGATVNMWAIAGVVGLIVAYRALSDWNREYRELWWDREVD